MDILKLLLEKCPESVHSSSQDGNLPINEAAHGSKSPDFCRLLIEAYHRSVRIAGDQGMLPFHWACGFGTVATAEYLLNSTRKHK